MVCWCVIVFSGSLGQNPKKFGGTRSCLVPGTIDFEAPTGTTDWDPVQWRGTTGNDRCGISNFRGTTEKVGRAARERTCGTKGHELKIE